MAKYWRGPVIGINPDPGEYDGVLCRHPAKFAMPLLLFACLPRGKDAAFTIQERCMALAWREDGQELRSLNEIFIGHASHQSARYRITFGALKERHSSSGVIVATGTGCTGWARSIAEQRHLEHPLPVAADARLAWFVREPFPSVVTGTSVNFGFLIGDTRLQCWRWTRAGSSSPTASKATACNSSPASAARSASHRSVWRLVV